MIEKKEDMLRYAAQRGYTPADIELLQKAYDVAARYSKNRFRYRKKTRPFLHHLVSTCALLMQSNLNIETVVAGLLHSVKDDMPAVYALNPSVGEIVDGYFDTSLQARAHSVAPLTEMNNVSWAVIAIQLANSTDMVMAGEYAAPF